jgi:hypothetical protein
MNVSTLTPALLASALLSLVLEWFPGVASWFQALTPAKRAGINALLVALISIISVYGNCKVWGSTCPADLWAAIAEVLLTALLAAAGNQAVHAMTKREVFARWPSQP